MRGPDVPHGREGVSARVVDQRSFEQQPDLEFGRGHSIIAITLAAQSASIYRPRTIACLANGDVVPSVARPTEWLVSDRAEDHLIGLTPSTTFDPLQLPASTAVWPAINPPSHAFSVTADRADLQLFELLITPFAHRLTILVTHGNSLAVMAVLALVFQIQLTIAGTTHGLLDPVPDYPLTSRALPLAVDADVLRLEVVPITGLAGQYVRGPMTMNRRLGLIAKMANTGHERSPPL